MKRLTPRLLIALGCIGLAAHSAFSQEKVTVHSPGIHSGAFQRTDGPVVPYAIWIPADYSPEKKVPLILALHFGGEPRGAGRSMIQLLLRPAFADLGGVVIAPDSIAGRWNSPQNEDAVNALLGAIERTYSIDPRRVVVMGFSMGGAGTWYWADKYPDRFSAAIPLAGSPTGLVANWRVPVFAIHSRDDQVVPIGPTIQRIADLKAKGVNAQLLEVQGISHYETNRFAAPLREAVPWLKEVWRSAR